MSVIKTITVMGATGSIGQSTLALVRQFPEFFSVRALVAGSDAEGLAALAHEFRPKMIGLHDLRKLDQLRTALVDIDVEILDGEAGCTQIATSPVDMVIAGIVGIAGLPSVLAAVHAGQTIALANKEALVSAGGLVMREAARCGAHILPIDSEHNAVFQCWQGWAGHQDDLVNASGVSGISRICLTASGGPFRDRDLDSFDRITAAEAVRHPNWKMGQKISVDSATMMNKGLEVIEAAWMFDLGPAQIDVLVHPQVAVHGLVYFNDGSVIGQLGTADMKTPISFALAWPDRLDWKPEPLDLLSFGSLDFMAVEEARYPCFFLARQALASGGIMPAVLNAANEVAVAAFLIGRIGFTGIGAIVDNCLQNPPDGDVRSLEAVLEIDARTRRLAETRCES